MSLLRAILTSDYLTLVQGLDHGENVNAVLNGDPPKSLLDIAIEADSENSTVQSKAIISLLRTKGALTYAAIQTRQVAAPLALATPAPLAAPVPVTIKNAGIAGVGLPRRRVNLSGTKGGRRTCRRRLLRKSRRRRI